MTFFPEINPLIINSWLFCGCCSSTTFGVPPSVWERGGSLLAELCEDDAWSGDVQKGGEAGGGGVICAQL